MFVSDLFETRRFVRPNAMQKLAQFADDRDVFITFTEVLKVGINPMSRWSDPVGIYAYPLPEMFEGKTSNEGHLIPFAAERRLCHILKAEGSILEMQDYTDLNLETDLDHLLGKFWPMLIKNPPGKNIENPAAYWEERFQSWMHKWRNSDPGEIFWEITRQMALFIERRSPGRDYRMIWNTLIRSCGYDVVVDRGGGWISSNEPAQAVFLHSGAVHVMETLPNDLNGRPDMSRFDDRIKQPRF
jgi:hypothetical protein